MILRWYCAPAAIPPVLPPCRSRGGSRQATSYGIRVADDSL